MTENEIYSRHSIRKQVLSGVWHIPTNKVGFALREIRLSSFDIENLLVFRHLQLQCFCMKANMSVPQSPMEKSYHFPEILPIQAR
jgi:hypothetical protein